MSLTWWVALYLLTSLLWLWVVFLGGAERLEGTLASGLLVDWLAPRWSADGIRLFVGLSWVLQTLWFAIGLFVPEVRFWWW
jgi:hypothetical protein